MLSSALLSLGVAGSALAWPGVGHSRHSSIARAIHARQEPAVKAKEPVAATWFASWHADEFSLANVSWSKYTTVSYSFAVTTPNISYVNISDPEVFKDFVSTAHANNVSATISIGGWTGSLYFSSAVATAENRTEFVKTMVSLLEDNNLDGLSFDWEYPGASGVGCNTKSPNDTDNFLLFLKELRTALPSNATLSAATSITPFLSADGTPSTNVSEFASVFDYIQLMNYDVWGSWSDTTGPNAPLNDTCATNATQKVGSAVSAVEAWTKAGFPADQLVLGVAGYGHGFSVAPSSALTDGILNAYSPFNKSFTPPGDAWDDAPVNGTVDVCGNPQAQGGTWNFWGLIEGGFLNENGTANTAEGIAYKYDECSQTPFVYNQTSGVFVAFDNAASFTAKGQFINTTGLRGFALWEAGGDFDDILLDAIRSGAGFPEVVEDSDDCSDDETGTTTPVTGSTSTNSGSNNSGSTSTSTSSSNSGSTSSNSGSTSSSSTSGSTSSNNNSGSNSSNNSGSNGSSSSSSTSTSTSSNSGSNNNNSGSNNSGSSTTTPDDGDDDDDCEDDDEYSEPEVTTTKANPTTYQAPTAAATTTTPSTSTAQSVATPEATLPDGDDDDEECEDDETIIDATTSVTASATASATSTLSAASTNTVSVTSSAATASATSSDATVTSTVSESSGTLSAASSTATESAVTSTSVSSESSTVTETASTSQATPSADKEIVSSSSAASSSYESSATSSKAEATTSVSSSSSAASTSSEPAPTGAASSESFESTTSARQTSSYSEASSAPTTTSEPSTSATPTSTHPAPAASAPSTTSEPVETPAASTSSSSSSSLAASTTMSSKPGKPTD